MARSDAACGPSPADTTAKSLGRCLEGSQAATSTCHNAAGLCAGVAARSPSSVTPLVKEALRLLRVAEGATRSAQQALAEALDQLQARPTSTRASQAGSTGTGGLTKSAKKRAKAREKRKSRVTPEVVPMDDVEASSVGLVPPQAIGSPSLQASSRGAAPPVSLSTHTLPVFITVGATVIVSGLSSRTDLNEQRGTVLGSRGGHCPRWCASCRWR